MLALIVTALMLMGGPLWSAAVADEPVANSLRWSLRDEFQTGRGRQNPNVDRAGQATWHFLRTTSSRGPVETREWLRDGKYALLSEQGENLFQSPLDGWIFRGGSPLAPAVGKLAAPYDVGLKFQPGEILVAPGPDHAVVIGWRSPIAGRLEIQGAFEHAQTCCGENSRIKWYVERGPAPDESRGFTPKTLAAGEADFGSETPSGAFHVRDEPIAPDEFIYFVVDARADGTATPHYGDATRFHVTLTVRDPATPPPPSFEKEILPLLARKCHDCHGADLCEAKLDLRTLSEMLRGGESGPAIVRGIPQESLLIDLVTKGQMPPEGGDKVSPAELALLRRWIVAGAPAEERIVALPPHAQVTAQDRAYWAFQPPRKGAEPSVKLAGRVRTPIDRFLLAKLEEKELEFSPDADRATLIRRASIDLLGLPPAPESVDRFLADTRPDAYELLIDELLKSPHYGERWGRHWLDAAGYVDGKLDNDLGTLYPNQGIWRYRDYVIRAFNDDKPFDRFLTEQLAGDELVDWRRAEAFDATTLSLLTATGFLRNVDDHTDFPQYGIEKRYEVVNETLDMVSTAVLGLTMECCRCHNHKYDPLPQRDYYRLMACFEPAFNVHAWRPPATRTLADVSPSQRAQIDQRNAGVDKQVADLAKAESATREQVRMRLINDRLAAIPDDIKAEMKRAVELKPEQRTAEQAKLVEQDVAARKVTDPQIDAALAEPERSELKANADRRATLLATKKSYGFIQALWDVGPPPLSHVHRRGNVKALGVLVQPGFPEILQPASPGGDASVRATVGHEQTSSGRKNASDADSRAATPGTLAAITNAVPTNAAITNAAPTDVAGETSGRRLALARWLTRPEHPLTARVFVNRVWHHHFGRGIVETLGNFGHSGSPPSHPELLDWLAVDFIEHGWSVKRLHRQIMLSTAYRQMSRRAPLALAASTTTTTAGNTANTASGRAAGGQVLGGQALGGQAAGERDGSRTRLAGETVDPENRLLWRMNLRRLESEIVRDAILAVSGALDKAACGPPVEITNPANGLSEVKAGGASANAARRSVYLFARRVYPLKFLEIFDAPIMPVNCTQRSNSANVLQSLAMLNSEFVFAQAELMADRTFRLAAAQATVDRPGRAPIEVAVNAAVPAANDTRDDALVKLAFQLAFARQPTADELTRSRQFLAEQRLAYKTPRDKQAADPQVAGKPTSDAQPADKAAADKAERAALADLCHMLLSANEFLYVE